MAHPIDDDRGGASRHAFGSNFLFMTDSDTMALEEKLKTGILNTIQQITDYTKSGLAGDSTFLSKLTSIIQNGIEDKTANPILTVINKAQKLDNRKNRFNAVKKILKELMTKPALGYQNNIKQLRNYLKCVSMKDGKYMYNPEVPCDVDRSLSASEKSPPHKRQRQDDPDLITTKQETTIRNLTNKMQFYFGTTINAIDKNPNEWDIILDPDIKKALQNSKFADNEIFVNVPSAFILDVLIFDDDGMERENNIRIGKKYRLESIDNWSNEERYNMLWYIDRDFVKAENVEQLSWYIVANMDPNGYIPCRLIVSNKFKGRAENKEHLSLGRTWDVWKVVTKKNIREIADKTYILTEISMEYKPKQTDKTFEELYNAINTFTPSEKTKRTADDILKRDWKEGTWGLTVNDVKAMLQIDADLRANMKLNPNDVKLDNPSGYIANNLELSLAWCVAETLHDFMRTPFQFEYLDNAIKNINKPSIYLNTCITELQPYKSKKESKNISKSSEIGDFGDFKKHPASFDEAFRVNVNEWSRHNSNLLFYSEFDTINLVDNDIPKPCNNVQPCKDLKPCKIIFGIMGASNRNSTGIYAKLNDNERKPCMMAIIKTAMGMDRLPRMFVNRGALHTIIDRTVCAATVFDGNSTDGSAVLQRAEDSGYGLTKGNNALMYYDRIFVYQGRIYTEKDKNVKEARLDPDCLPTRTRISNPDATEWINRCYQTNIPIPNDQTNDRDTALAIYDLKRATDALVFLAAKKTRDGIFVTHDNMALLGARLYGVPSILAAREGINNTYTLYKEKAIGIATPSPAGTHTPAKYSTDTMNGRNLETNAAIRAVSDVVSRMNSPTPSHFTSSLIVPGQDIGEEVDSKTLRSNLIDAANQIGTSLYNGTLTIKFDFAKMSKMSNPNANTKIVIKQQGGRHRSRSPVQRGGADGIPIEDKALAYAIELLVETGQIEDALAQAAAAKAPADVDIPKALEVITEALYLVYYEHYNIRPRSSADHAMAVLRSPLPDVDPRKTDAYRRYMEILTKGSSSRQQPNDRNQTVRKARSASLATSYQGSTKKEEARAKSEPEPLPRTPAARATRPTKSEPGPLPSAHTARTTGPTKSELGPLQTQWVIPEQQVGTTRAPTTRRPITTPKQPVGTTVANGGRP